MIIKDDNYYVVKGWMLTRLGLKGTQLTLYAILHGFSQDGRTAFRGSIRYLSELAGVTQQAVRDNLHELERKKLITVRRNEAGEVNSYFVTADHETIPQPPERPAIKKSDQRPEIAEVIEYLNRQAGSKYKATDSTTAMIAARLNEGFTTEDMKKVIDIKSAEWRGTDFEKYLRPQTLFGSKFQAYLNQKAKAETERSYDLEKVKGEAVTKKLEYKRRAMK